MCRPGLSVTLLDSVSRACIALEAIVRSVGLGNARIACMRSEEMARAEREKYLVAAARAVTATGPLAELLSPLVSVGGILLAFKGPAGPEMEPVGGKWSRLGLADPTLYPYALGEKERSLVLWEKRAPCPGTYPRNPAMLEKTVR